MPIWRYGGRGLIYLQSVTSQVALCYQQEQHVVTLPPWEPQEKQQAIDLKGFFIIGTYRVIH